MNPLSLGNTVAVSLSKSEFDSQASIVAMAQALIKRAQEETQVNQAVDFSQADLYEAQTEKGKLLNFKDRNADTTSALSKSRSALEWVENHLKSMKTELLGITPASTTEQRAAASAEYDRLVTEINGRVSGATQIINYIPTNLVGNPTIPEFSTSDVYAPISPNGGSVRVEGHFLGTDFMIEDAEGLLWHREEGKNAFVQYVTDGTGAPTGTEIDLEGLILESFDSSTGAVSFIGSGSLTGTIHRHGVGVLTSEYHNALAADGDVTTAIADIDAALSTLSTQGALIEAQASVIESSIKSITAKIETLDSEISRLIEDQLDENEAARAAADLKLKLTLNNINLLSSNSKGLVENIVVATQGLGPAPGVFGALGY